MTSLNSTNIIKTKKIRVGRGIGSGKGKTSGRGIKGQKSRSGVAIKSFEGGQMPLYRRLPKRGFSVFNKMKIAKINLEKLKKENVINKSYSTFKILGLGEISHKIDVEVNSLSKSAKSKIEKVGGSIKIINLK